VKAGLISDLPYVYWSRQLLMLIAKLLRVLTTNEVEEELIEHDNIKRKRKKNPEITS
jgi:hypothetical protein